MNTETPSAEDKLSSANAKIAELESTLVNAVTNAKFMQRCANDTSLAKEALQKQNLELTSKCEKLTGYLAHEATLNLELEATVEKMRGVLDSHLRLDCAWDLGSVLAQLCKAVRHLRDDHDCDTDGHEAFWGALETAEQIDLAPLASALSLTPSSALLAYALELAERAFREGWEDCDSGDYTAPGSAFMNSDTRRSITKEKDL